MGEPIRLWKGKEEVTVNAQSEAAVLVAKGWAVGPRPADVLAANAPAPAGDEAPTPAAKPTPKRAGEYGAGAGTQRVVDKAEQKRVAEEQAEDKRQGLK